MKIRNWAAILPAALLIMALVAGVASADVITVGANSSIQETVQADEGESLSITWTSSSSVRLVLQDPLGYTVRDVAGTFRTMLIDVDRTGTYTLTWYNTGSSSVSVDRTIEVIPVSVEGFFDSLATVILIVALGIVAVVVVIVLVVVFVLKKDKAGAQPAYQTVYSPPPPGPMPPVSAVPGICPLCKAATRPEMVFCEKCGARLR